MVELLVVILIVAILVGLLVPAILSAVRSANAARCTADINALVTALTSFKSTYNDYPPSRIILHESGFYNGADGTLLAAVYNDGRNDITVGSLNQRSARYLQKFFPRAQVFSTSNSSGTLFPNGPAYDINGNGVIDSNPWMLTGDECLVFFLGGMGQASTGANGSLSIGMAGFAKDPSNPFNRGVNSRTVPIMDFSGGRLVDPDGDGFPSYLDTYGTTDPSSRPYAYFSSYGSGNYDPNDCNTLPLGTSDPFSPTGWQDPHGGDDSFGRAFNLTFQVSTNGFNSPCYTLASGQTLTGASAGPNPYTVSAPISQNGTIGWQNAQTFQIISAGADQLFGIGGSWTSQGNASLPLLDNGGFCSGSSGTTRQQEGDNLSNFTTGRLD